MVKREGAFDNFWKEKSRFKNRNVEEYGVVGNYMHPWIFIMCSLSNNTQAYIFIFFLFPFFTFIIFRVRL